MQVSCLYNFKLFITLLLRKYVNVIVVVVDVHHTSVSNHDDSLEDMSNIVDTFQIVV